MNYQVAPFWIYSGTAALSILFSVILAFWGMNAFAFYLLFIGIIWQVLISIKIHFMKEKGLILEETDVTQWLVYIHGIPVKETRNELKNPNFAIEKQTVSFFLMGFLFKAIFQLFFVILLVKQFLTRDIFSFEIENMIAIGCFLLAFFILSYLLFKTLRRIIEIKQKQIIIEMRVSPSGSQWFQLLFMQHKDKQTAALTLLLAI